jgi:hypothetical protein
MDAAHFEIVAGEYLAKLAPAAKVALLTEVDRARQFVSTLPPESGLEQAALRPVTGQHVAAIAADSTFQQAFAGRGWSWQWVRLDKLLALQSSVQPRHDSVPSSEPGLIEWALPPPSAWEVPVEVSFVQPAGPIQITTSTPFMNGVRMEFDQANGRVIISPPIHPNLVTVARANNRHVLMNGYHRVHDAIAAGKTELPALLIHGPQAQDLNLGPAGFGGGYALNLARPPMLKDFGTPASVDAEERERRYGMVIALNFTPISIGI